MSRCGDVSNQLIFPPKFHLLGTTNFRFKKIPVISGVVSYACVIDQITKKRWPHIKKGFKENILTFINPPRPELKNKT